MATTKLVTRESAQNPNPQADGVRSLGPLDTNAYNAAIGGTVSSIRQEVDDAFADMKTFHQLEPDAVMRITSGHSARLSEIRVRIMRIEDFAREWKPVRTREVEPALEELERQYTIASRLHSVRELDYRMETGER